MRWAGHSRRTKTFLRKYKLSCAISRTTEVVCGSRPNGNRRSRRAIDRTTCRSENRFALRGSISIATRGNGETRIRERQQIWESRSAPHRGKDRRCDYRKRQRSAWARIGARACITRHSTSGNECVEDACAQVSRLRCADGCHNARLGSA